MSESKPSDPLSEPREVDLFRLIRESIEEQSASVSNRKVTLAHYYLSEGLQNLIGKEAGPNFHSWAVWGSKKAGVTIRQEDLNEAIGNATVVAGIAGFLVGIATAAIVIWFFVETSLVVTSLLLFTGGMIGAVTGASVGRAIARYSRAEAARLILEGNQTVLEDIGTKTALFIETFQGRDFDDDRWTDFLARFTEGRTSDGGQNLLKEAFRAYSAAVVADTREEKSEMCCFGNCLIILHEHLRLQPYISKSLPHIIRRCVTRRMMSFEVGQVSLSVAEEFSSVKNDYQPVELKDGHKKALVELMRYEFPSESVSLKNLFGPAKKYGADNWTRIEQRMRYIWELFERFHLEPQVVSKPYSGQPGNSWE